MNSFKVVGGKSLRATTTMGVPAAIPIGAKSLVGSYLRFLYSAGAAPCVPMCPIMMV